MPDAQFEDPRLAALYDLLDPDRSDLDAYAALVCELGARSVLDVGCGTGTFACMLASQGLDVVGLDPAAASLEVAGTKPGAQLVRWVHGDAASMATLGVEVDLATMTGNVAQVFVTDREWIEALASIRRAVRPGGHFAFESRVPEDEAWLRWTMATSLVGAEVPGVGQVVSWVEVTDAREDLVTFRSTYAFGSEGTRLTSVSTLRFRTLDELSRSLESSGFRVREVRGAPDRPGREHVFVAERL